MKKYFSRNRNYIDIIDALLDETDSHRNPARVREEMVTGAVTRDEINSDIYMLYLNALEPDMVCAGDYPEKGRILELSREAGGSLKIFVKSDRNNLLADSLVASLAYESVRYLGVIWKANRLIGGSRPSDNPEIMVTNLEDGSPYGSRSKNEPAPIVEIISVNDLSSDIDMASDILSSNCLILQPLDITSLVKVAVVGERGKKLISDTLGKDESAYFSETEEFLVDSRVYATIVSIDALMEMIGYLAKKLIIEKIAEKLFQEDILPQPWKYSPTHMLIHGFLQPIYDAVELNSFDRGRYYVSTGLDRCAEVHSNDGDIKSISYHPTCVVEFKDGHMDLFESSDDLLDLMRHSYGLKDSVFDDFLLNLAI